MAFFWMKNDALGSEVQFPEEDGVQEHWEARGWIRVPDPEPEPFVPVPVNSPAGDDSFIPMWHSGLKQHHDFPNNSDAIKGAEEAGWVRDLPTAPEVPEESETPAQSRKTSKAKPEPTGSEKGTEK